MGEDTDGVIVFNPNSDNALSMKGDPESLQCHLAAQLAQGARPREKTGGRMIQIIVGWGLSEMQEAEAGAWRRIRASRL